MAPELLPFPSTAVWIGSDHPFDLHEAYLCFRSPPTLRLEQIPQAAELYITADSRYKLWINGRFVARGPARSYPQYQAVDRLEISSYLQSGRNILAVQVYQPGYSHFSYLHRGAAGLLACLICDGEAVLATGSGWKTRRDPSFSANVPRVSIYGTGVEERDLRLAERWMDPDYPDSDWTAPRVVAPVGGYPWIDLRLRTIPRLVEEDTPLTPIETRGGTLPESDRSDPHLMLQRGWISAASVSYPMDQHGWLSPDLAQDEAAYWLFDLGRDYACQGRVIVEAAGGQEQLSISYQEKIRAGELVISDPETYCRVRLTDRFQLRPGSQTAETFALRGGRYLLIQLTGPTGPEFRFRPFARISKYPLKINRKLPMSDPVLAGVITICEDTFRACLQDGFVDCVWRESSQWLGDALPQTLIMASMSEDLRPLRQVIEMAAQGAYPDGVLPSILPGEVHAYAVVDYNFTWVELLLLYWRLSGDEALISNLWPVLLKMMDRFDKDRNGNGLLLSQPGRRLFLDWAPLSRNEPNAVYNFRYLFALQQAGKLAEERVLFTDGARLWETRAANLRTALRAAFWHEKRWYDDRQQTTFSQLAASLALLTETTPAEAIEAQLDAIAHRSLDMDDDPAPDKMVLASPFMHHYIFEALRRHGRSETVVEIIRRRWGRWVTAGYPTTWENWNVDFPDGSQCHAFSAHPRYHLAEIARELGGL